MFRTWQSPNTAQSITYDNFLDLDTDTIPRSSSSMFSGTLPRTMGTPVNDSHFYEDSSEDEMPTLDDYSDISFNPWAKSKRSSLGDHDNRSSMTSFRFADTALTRQSDASINRTSSSSRILRERSIHQSKPSSASTSTQDEDLQVYAQALLQGNFAEGIHQEMDLYQECFPKRQPQASHFLSPKQTPASRERAAHNKDQKRVSIMSTASDASAVPSLIFSDADGQARRQSTTLSFNVQTPSPKALHRNSLISLSSIDTMASNRSWFMDDESPLPSPLEPEPLGKRASFTRGVELGLSCFDDGDDEEEEEVDEVVSDLKGFRFPECPGIRQMGTNPQESTQNRTKKLNPGLTIKTMAPQDSPTSLNLPLPPFARSPLSPKASPICAMPNRRRSRRRTASSECIVLEALEKMNAVMYDFANEDINRKSVVGLDLPGNQVSVEAYGELWW